MESTTLDSWERSVAPFLGPLARVAAEFTALTGVPVDPEAELFQRARLGRLRPRGRTSAGGSCHLLRTGDGWAAVNLARSDDHAAVPALANLLGGPSGPEPGTVAGLRGAAASHPAAEVAGHAQLLGVAASALGSERGARPPVVRRRPGARGAARTGPGVRVADFSALWAGPLCARLLGLAGARVTKLESTDRPDGARHGAPALYRRLHHGHDSLVLDFTAPGVLLKTVAEADVVIEASRPRALRRLGLDPERFLAARPGRVWVSITGYGREDDRIAFGDDAAVAGGLVGQLPDGGPGFLGDAVADPVTGIFAAHAVARSLADGGGHLLCVSMAACASALAAAADSRPC